MLLKGKAWVFGNDIDTDVIIPARYLNVFSGEELKQYAFQDYMPNFSEEVNQGDIIIAGENFGCGSSREHAPLALKAAGISCVVANSFARIFYRNSVNLGLYAVECPDDLTGTEHGDEITVNLETGEVINLTKERRYQANKYPDFMREIVSSGGLVEFTKKKVRDDA